MDEIRDQFQAARHEMIGAIADLTTLALRAGASEDAVSEIQARFFDGNVALKKAFRVVLLLAEIRNPDVSRPAGAAVDATAAGRAGRRAPRAGNADPPPGWLGR